MVLKLKIKNTNWFSDIQNTVLTLNLVKIKRPSSRPPMAIKLDMQKVDSIKLVLDSRNSQKHVGVIILDSSQPDPNF